MADPDELLTIPGIAALTKWSERFVKELVASGALPSIVNGRTRRVRRTDLRAYIDTLPTNTPTPDGLRPGSEDQED